MIETFLNGGTVRDNVVLVGYPVVTAVGREMREDVICESLVTCPRRPKGVEIEAVCGIQLLLDIKGRKSSYGSTKRVSGDLNGGCGVLSE